MGCIYLIRNLRNNKCYIGQTIRDAEKTRIRQHLNGHGNQYLKNAINKYGKAAFTFEILHDGIIPEFLDMLEIEAIAKFKTLAPHGYNLDTGGGAGRSPSEEARRKMSEARKGKNVSEKTKCKMSEAQKGRKHSAASKEKMSEARKGKIPWNKDKKGKPRSEETRRKIAKSLKGKKASIESRRKMSEARKGKKGQIPWNKGKSTHPFHPVAHQFFLSLPASLSKTEKNKRLYDQFPNIPRRSIQRWTCKWQSELDK